LNNMAEFNHYRTFDSFNLESKLNAKFNFSKFELNKFLSVGFKSKQKDYQW